MRYFLFLLLALGFTASATAQFGLGVGYNFHRTQLRMVDADEGPFGEEYLGNAPEVSLNYWFRLPNRRLEFLPTVYYHENNLRPSARRNFTFRSYGLEFRTRAYVLDFGADCNCPTFGKQGPKLNKGLYLEVSPGYGWTSENADGATANNASFTLGGGLGIDFGVTNAITATPYLNARYFTSDIIGPLNPYPDLIGIETRSNLFTLQPGIHIAVRLDERNY